MTDSIFKQEAEKQKKISSKRKRKEKLTHLRKKSRQIFNIEKFAILNFRKVSKGFLAKVSPHCAKVDFFMFLFVHMLK